MDSSRILIWSGDLAGAYLHCAQTLVPVHLGKVMIEVILCWYNQISMYIWLIHFLIKDYFRIFIADVSTSLAREQV